MNSPQVAYRCEEHGTRLGRCCASANRVFPLEEEMRDDGCLYPNCPDCNARRKKPEPETLKQILARARETADDREARYGADGYRQLGDVMVALFPKGMFLHDAEDFARFYLMEKMVEKLCRYVRSYAEGGHPDSIHDLGVYAFKMEEHDSRNRHRR